MREQARKIVINKLWLLLITIILFIVNVILFQ